MTKTAAQRSASKGRHDLISEARQLGSELPAKPGKRHRLAVTTLNEHQQRMSREQPLVVTTDQTPRMAPGGLPSANSGGMITITGIGDHDQPDRIG